MMRNLTDPTTILTVGIAIGALLAFSLCIVAGGILGRRREKWMDAILATRRRYEAALRDILAAIDRGDDAKHVKRIARRGLYPNALALKNDTPIIPEAQGNG